MLRKFFRTVPWTTALPYLYAELACFIVYLQLRWMLMLYDHTLHSPLKKTDMYLYGAKFL